MADTLQPMMVYMGNTGIIVFTILLVINIVATLLVFLRVLARTKMSKNLGRDDVMLVLGWVSGTYLV